MRYLLREFVLLGPKKCHKETKSSLFETRFRLKPTDFRTFLVSRGRGRGEAEAEHQSADDCEESEVQADLEGDRGTQALEQVVEGREVGAVVTLVRGPPEEV